jgi:DNA repair exonuclease SbcCD ATPase subunit
METEDLINEERGVVIRPIEDDLPQQIPNYFDHEQSYDDYAGLPVKQRNPIPQQKPKPTKGQISREMLRKKKARQREIMEMIDKGLEEKNRNLQTTVNQSRNRHQTEQPNRNPDSQFRVDELISELDHLRNEHSKVKALLEIKDNEKKDLLFKMQSSEKYWQNKIKNLEENYRGLNNKLEGARKEVKVAEKNIVILNEENKRLQELTDNFTKFQQNNESNNEKYQDKIAELMRTNGDLFRQCETMKEKNSDLGESRTKMQAQIEELRRLIKDYEHNLQKVHGNSLKSNELAIQRYEELSTKYKNLQLVCEEQVKQIAELQKKEQGLYKENVEWSNVLKDKVKIVSNFLF